MDNCQHEETIINDNKEICAICCEIVSTNEILDQNNSFYGLSETKYNLDPSRCHKRKTGERNIFKDVEKLDFNYPESIIEKANDKYQIIIKDNIYRGAKRKSIIVACIYYSYIDLDIHQTVDSICENFKIQKKNIKEGFSKFLECFPDYSNKYVSCKNLINNTMIQTHVEFSHIGKIQQICDTVNGKHQVLNRSSPQSVAAAVVYVYLCQNPEYKNKLGFSNKKKFATEVGLSEITITKLAKEIANIIQPSLKI